MKKYYRGVLLMVLNTILWGAAPPIIERFMNVPVDVYLLYRFILATALLYFLMLILNKRLDFLFWIKHLDLAFWAAIQNVGVLLLYFEGLGSTNAAFAAILSAIVPVFSSILGVLFLKERLNKNEKIGMLLALISFVGLSYISLPTDSISSTLKGVVLLTIGNILFVLSVFFVKKIEKQEGLRLPKDFSWQFNLVGFASSAIVLFGFVLFRYPSYLTSLNFILLLSNFGVWYLAIFASIIALVAYVKALEYMEVSEVMYYVYLQPLLALPLSALLVGLNLNWWLYFVFAIIDMVAFRINIKR